MQTKKSRFESGHKLIQFNNSKFSKLEKEKLEAARSELTAPQHLRFFDFVMRKPGVRTWQVARHCSIGYPPCRALEVNAKIAKHGLRLFCVPPKLITSRHGETNSHAWFIGTLTSPVAKV